MNLTLQSVDSVTLTVYSYSDGITKLSRYGTKDAVTITRATVTIQTDPEGVIKVKNFHVVGATAKGRIVSVSQVGEARIKYAREAVRKALLHHAHGDDAIADRALAAIRTLALEK